MNNLIIACNENLNSRGYVTRNIDIKRAYWRLAKQLKSIDIGLLNQVSLITEYLLLNNRAKPAYKFQIQPDTKYYSDCCDAEILHPDLEGHGYCAECGDNATPVNPVKETEDED